MKIRCCKNVPHVPVYVTLKNSAVFRSTNQAIAIVYSVNRTGVLEASEQPQKENVVSGPWVVLKMLGSKKS